MSDIVHMQPQRLKTLSSKKSKNVAGLKNTENKVDHAIYNSRNIDAQLFSNSFERGFVVCEKISGVLYFFIAFL